MRVRLLRVTETIFEWDRLGTERIKQAWESETDNKGVRQWSKQWESETDRRPNLNTWHSGSVSAAPVIWCFFSPSLSLSDAEGLWKGSTERYSFLGKETLETAPIKAQNPDDWSQRCSSTDSHYWSAAEHSLMSPVHCASRELKPKQELHVKKSSKRFTETHTRSWFTTASHARTTQGIVSEF